MNRRIKRNYRKKSKIKETVYAHIRNNGKEYTIVSIIFIIGIIIGVVFVNNISENQKNEVSEYLVSSIQLLKNDGVINEFSLLKDSIRKKLWNCTAFMVYGFYCNRDICCIFNCMF